MGRVPITVMGYHCERCEHEWIPRKFVGNPRVCPNCKSPYWDSPTAARSLTYPEFRARIQHVFQSLTSGLTWTELRTHAKLPQAFPNQEWIQQLEKDLYLERYVDEQDLIRWKLSA